ncbi:hypothetical protein ALIPUT_02356 [Alistipes putredinis DSM 17216]|uniref:Uncharacterized protein n=1 Tax=Alistipes putredinis DSM 17216 TaxID=445970 RepID=B0MYY7_9BACT|nr:hypothetical protein ALIPUT_02356 [Alistipes putredinis DSM 17216]
MQADLLKGYPERGICFRRNEFFARGLCNLVKGIAERELRYLFLLRFEGEPLV